MRAMNKVAPAVFALIACLLASAGAAASIDELPIEFPLWTLPADLGAEAAEPYKIIAVTDANGVQHTAYMETFCDFGASNPQQWRGQLRIWYSNNHHATRTLSGWAPFSPVVDIPEFDWPVGVFELVRDFSMAVDKDGGVHIVFGYGFKDVEHEVTISHAYTQDQVPQPSKEIATLVGATKVKKLESFKFLDLALGQDESMAEQLHVVFVSEDSVRARSLTLPVTGDWSGEETLDGTYIPLGVLSIDADKSQNRVSALYAVEDFSVKHSHKTGGSGWSSETVPGAGEPMDVARDAGGGVHTLSYSIGESIYLSKDAGWSSPDSFPGVFPAAVRVDGRAPDYRAHLLLVGSGGLEWTRQAGGAGAEEWAPLRPLYPGTPAYAAALTIDQADHAHAVWFKELEVKHARTFEPNLGAQDDAVMVGFGPGTLANAANGNLFSSLALFETGGVGFPLSFSLMHNSREAAPGLVSQGWTTSYDFFLTRLEDGSEEPEARLPYRVHYPDGSSVIFRFDSDHGYHVAEPHFGDSSKLIPGSEPDTEVVRIDKRGTEYHFDTKGRLLEIRDLNSNIPPLEIEYEDNPASPAPDSVPVKITDSVGRSITLQYNARNQLKTLIDPLARSINLSYDVEAPSLGTHRLERVRLANRSHKLTSGATASSDFDWSFGYYIATDPGEKARRDQLSFVKTPRGSEEDFGTGFTYAADGWVLSSLVPGVSFAPEGSTTASPGTLTTRIEYVSKPSTLDPELPVDAEITDTRGHLVVLLGEYRRSLPLELHRQSLGDDCPAGWLYDASTPNLLLAYNHRCDSMLFEYYESSPSAGFGHVFDNLKSVLAPGLPEASKSVYTYTTGAAPNRIASETDAMGGLTSHSYDAHGNRTASSPPTRKQYTNANPPALTDITTGTGQSWSFDDLNRMTAATDAAGHSTTYSYDCAADSGTGLVCEVQVEGETGATRYAHDTLGNLTATSTDTSAGEATTSTHFDGLDRPDQVTSPPGDGGTAVHQTIYDADGALIASIAPGADGSPLVTAYTLNTVGWAVSTEQAAGTPSARSATTIYNAAGEAVKTTDFEGAAMSFSLDPRGLVETAVPPSTSETTPPSATSYTHDSNGNVLSKTLLSSPPVTLSYEYDERDNLIRTDYPATAVTVTQEGSTDPLTGGTMEVTASRVELFSYNCADELVLHQLRLEGGVERFLTGTFYDRDEWGNARRTVALDQANDPGASFSACAGSTGLPSFASPADNIHAYTIRDVRNLPVQTFLDMDGTTPHLSVSTVYDAAARQTETRDSNGVVTSDVVYTPDSLFDITQQPDPTAALGSPAAMVTATEHDYSKLGQLKEAKDIFGATVTNTFHPSGVLKSSVDPLGHTSTLTHDVLGRVETGSQPLSSTQACTSTVSAYDDNGRATGFADTNGKPYAFTYDSAGRRYKETHPGGHIYSMDFDDRGFVEFMIEPLNNVRHFERDALGRVVSETIYTADNSVDPPAWVEWKTLSYKYHGRGNLVEQDDGTLRITSLHDSLGRLVKTSWYLSGVLFKSIEYKTFDKAGNPTEIIGPEGNVWTRAFDANGRLVSEHKDGNPHIANIQYDSAGRERLRTLGNGMTSARSYDEKGRLKSLRHTGAGGLLAGYSYIYNADDTIQSVVQENLGGLSTAFAYDGHGNLASEDATLATPPPGFSNSYADGSGGNTGAFGDVACAGLPGASVTLYSESLSYDCQGNRTAKDSTLSGNVSYEYSATEANRLTREWLDTGGSPASIEYGYDDNGNLLSRDVPAGVPGLAAGLYAMSYDPLNRLVGVDGPTGSWSYDFTPAGDRYSKKNTADASQTVKHFVVGRETVADYDGSHALTALYAGGQGLDRKTAVYPSSDPAAEPRYLLSNQIGTASTGADASGTRDKIEHATAWGESATHYAGAPLPVGFHGAPSDEESGWVYFRQRMYDPRLGRFIQNDPVDPVGQHYAGFGNDPLSLMDPLGLDLIVRGDSAFRQEVRTALKRIHPALEVGADGKVSWSKKVWKPVSKKNSKRKSATQMTPLLAYYTSYTYNFFKELISSKNPDGTPTQTTTIRKRLGANSARAWRPDDANKKGGKPGPGSPGTVYWSASHNLSPAVKITKPDGTFTIKRRPRPPFLGLIHELIHTRHYILGIRSVGKTNIDVPRGSGKKPLKCEIRTEEAVTIGVGDYRQELYSENTWRRLLAMHPRIRHSRH